MNFPVTRFAPSPTGSVHIGNIRVAIFNWLYARHAGGKFLLRIEDTDRERSRPEAIHTLLDVMNWFKLNADEKPVYQSARREAHLEAAQTLLSKGFAYKDNLGNPEKGEAIVFKMPGRDISFSDMVKGQLTKKEGDMKDLVIVRGDGSPVFHLANVLDDIFMNVNTVIRGDDHVENTFRHIALYQALGAEIPAFAHLPMIVNMQGKPYSKRDGDAFVGDFRDKDYFADALFNYLALLGWSPGDDSEIMSREEMINKFSFDGVQSSPAKMDEKKLIWINGTYLRQLSPGALKKAILPLPKEWNVKEEYLDRVLRLMRDRMKFPSDLVENAAYFFTDEFPYDEKAFRKRIPKKGVPKLLKSIKKALDDLTPFTAHTIESTLARVAEENELEPGKLNPILRVAVTGQSGGPGLFETLELLEKNKTLRHLDRIHI